MPEKDDDCCTELVVQAERVQVLLLALLPPMGVREMGEKERN